MNGTRFCGKKINELSDEMLDHFKNLLSNESYLLVFNPRPSDDAIQKTIDEIDSEIMYRETLDFEEDRLIEKFLEWRKTCGLEENQF